MKNYLTGLMLLLLSSLLVGCGNSDNVVSSGGPSNFSSVCNAGSASGSSNLTAIVTSTAPQTIHVGTSEKFTVYGVCSDGSNQDITSTVSWTSSDTTTATVSAAGIVQGVAVGNVNIVAQASGFTATVPVSVTAATLLSMQISPINFSTYQGLTTQYYAIGIYDDGTNQDLSLTSAWASSNTNIATIEANGLATAISSGSATISATYAGIIAASTLTVTSATLQSLIVTPISPVTMHIGVATQFTATGVYSDGGTADLTSSAQINWTSSSLIAPINAVNGLATGLRAGDATISATYGQQSAGVNVTVNAAVLEALIISPSTDSVPMGTNVQYTAQARFSDGSSNDVSTTAMWSVTNTDGSIRINNNGLLTVASSTMQFSAQVTATLGAQSASAQLQIISPSINAWTFIGGSQTPNDPGMNSPVSLQIVAAANSGYVARPGSNYLPSARANTANTVDSQGLFWMFGGQNYDATTNNDFWQYDKSTTSWTLITPTTGGASATPPSTADAAAFHVNNSFYMFGGWTFNDYTTISSQFFQYDMLTNTWTDLSSMAPAPSARYGHRIVAATDGSGNPIFYLFGGASGDSTVNNPVYLNDLWKFDPKSNSGSGGWTQLLSNSTSYRYGLQGVADASNQIPARAYPNIWMTNGKIWIFGGDVPNPSGRANDLWSIDPATGLQTWVTGNSDLTGPTDFATYGELGVPSSANTPGARGNSGASWVDTSGNLWLTSGNGFGISGLGTGTMNDVWQFNTQTLQWTWIGGQNYPGQPTTYAGVYGTSDIAAVSPSGRFDSAGWFDPNAGAFYLFGGYDGNFHNDLWRYNTSSYLIVNPPGASYR